MGTYYVHITRLSVLYEVMINVHQFNLINHQQKAHNRTKRKSAYILLLDKLATVYKYTYLGYPGQQQMANGDCFFSVWPFPYASANNSASFYEFLPNRSTENSARRRAGVQYYRAKLTFAEVVRVRSYVGTYVHTWPRVILTQAKINVTGFVLSLLGMERDDTLRRSPAHPTPYHATATQYQ